MLKETNIVLIMLATLGVSLYVISTIFLYEFHKKRNDKTPSFLLINLSIFGYVNKYKQITKDEKQRIGPLYYSWIISINMVMVFGGLLLMVNVIVR